MGPPRIEETLIRFLAPEARPGKKLCLSPEEAHHLRDVRRLGTSAKILLLDTQGREFLAQVEKVSRKEVWVRVLHLVREENPPAVEVWMALPLLKKDHLAFLVEKAVELDVSRVLLLHTERTIPKGDRGLREKLWRRGLQALKQCGRLWALEIEGPLSLKELAQKEATKKFLAYERAKRPLSPKDFSLSSNQRIIFFSGPEGGFSPQEVSFLKEAGFEEVSLGNRILRAETAALYLMSLAHFFLLKDWG